MTSRLSLVFGLALATALASAANPVGTWNGKLSMTQTPMMPANATPQQRANAQQMAAKVHFVLQLKADKTYAFTIMGIATGQAPRPIKGTWSQLGNTVMISMISSANTAQKAPPQKLVLSPDGKTMTIVSPFGKVVFTR